MKNHMNLSLAAVWTLRLTISFSLSLTFQLFSTQRRKMWWKSPENPICATVTWHWLRSNLQHPASLLVSVITTTWFILVEKKTEVCTKNYTQNKQKWKKPNIRYFLIDLTKFVETSFQIEKIWILYICIFVVFVFTRNFVVQSNSSSVSDTRSCSQMKTIPNQK